MSILGDRMVRNLVMWSRIEGDAGDSDPLSAIEWRALIDLAIRHGVAALVHQSTRQIPSVPEAARRRLSRQRAAWAWKNGRALAALARVAEAAERAEVPLIALKGAALIARVYPHPALRPLTDLDLLLHREDVERFVRVLSEHGFAQGKPEFPLRFYLRHHFSLPLRTGGSRPIELDLHWDIVDRFRWERPDLERLWEVSTEVELAGRRIATFEAGDLLLHAALHFAKHVPYVAALARDPDAATALVASRDPHVRLIWLVDVVELARRVPPGPLVENARREGCAAALRDVVALASRLHPCPEFATLLGELGPAGSAGVYTRVLRRAAESSSGRFHRVLHTESRGARIRPIRVLEGLRLLAPPREWIAERGALVVPLAYLVYGVLRLSRLLAFGGDLARFAFARSLRRIVDRARRKSTSDPAPEAETRRAVRRSGS